MSDPAVLVVDDQGANRLALEALLGAAQLRTVAAASGEEALLLLQREDPFALILMDVRMPGLNGFETSRIIREREKPSEYTPIIFLTAGAADEEFVSRAYSLGAVDFIAKPVMPEILRAKAQVFVELFRKTELLKAQAHRLRQTEELEAREKLQRRFISTVSHELRTPITAIRGAAETLRRGAVQDARHRLTFVRIIEKHADRLKWLVEDVLALNDLESGQGLPCPGRVAMRDFLEQTIGRISTRSARQRVRLAATLGDDAALVDRTHLSRVVLDLIERALRHSPKSETVGIAARREGDEILVSVRDAGIPPAAEELARLFEQFHRSADPRRLPDRGLGLYAVRGLIEANGGRMWAEIPDGRGLAVVFSLRAAERADDAPRSAPVDSARAEQRQAQVAG